MRWGCHCLGRSSFHKFGGAHVSRPSEIWFVWGPNSLNFVQRQFFDVRDFAILKLFVNCECRRSTQTFRNEIVQHLAVSAFQDWGRVSNASCQHFWVSRLHDAPLQHSRMSWMLNLLTSLKRCICHTHHFRQRCIFGFRTCCDVCNTPNVKIRSCSVCLDVRMQGFRCGGVQVVMSLWILKFEILEREHFGISGSLFLTLRVPCQGAHATRKIYSQVQWAHYGGWVFWKSKMMIPRKEADTMKWNVRTYAGRRSESVRFHLWGL